MYHNANRLPSPRPASAVSPPVSSNYQRSHPRRFVMPQTASVSPNSHGCWSTTTYGPHLRRTPPAHFDVHHSYPHPCYSSPASPSQAPFSSVYQPFPSHYSFSSPPSYGCTSTAPVYIPPQSSFPVTHGSRVTSPKQSPFGRHQRSTAHLPCANPTEADFLYHSGYGSQSCFSHNEPGWIGLPGRPLVGLIECLLDAAAAVVESDLNKSNNRNLLGPLEPAVFYLGLSLKVSLKHECTSSRYFISASPSLIIVPFRCRLVC